MVHGLKQFTLLSLLFIAATALIGCASGERGAREEEAFVYQEDILYGTGGDVELKLDLACPKKGRGPFPALVFIAGGGRQASHKASFRFEIRQAAERGYVGVTIDYRGTDLLENGRVKYTFPAQIHDVKCAVRYLRANAEKYRIDPDRIGTVGHSAGGHLALMLGLTDPSNGLEGECGSMSHSSRAQAVVGLAGPTELFDLSKEHPIFITALLGGTYDEVPEQYIRASHLTCASSDDPPVLIVHGDKDAIVPLKQAELLDAKMNEVGAPHTFVVTKSADHGAYVDDAVWEFLDVHLK